MTLLAISGIALVVAVFAVLMSMSEGFAAALRATGTDQNAMVVQRGSASELTSWIPIDQKNMITVHDAVARGTDGRPLVSPEVVVVTMKPKADGEPTNVTLRGVTLKGHEVRGGITDRPAAATTRPASTRSSWARRSRAACRGSTSARR